MPFYVLMIGIVVGVVLSRLFLSVVLHKIELHENKKKGRREFNISQEVVDKCFEPINTGYSVNKVIKNLIDCDLDLDPDINEE